MKMRSFDNQGLKPIAARQDRPRLETVADFRKGMTSSCMIGRKLGSMLGLSEETPAEIQTVLVKLDRKLTQRV